MARDDWMDLAEKLAKEGDKTQEIRRRLFEASVDSFMDDVSRQTQRKVEEDRKRGILRRSA